MILRTNLDKNMQVIDSYDYNKTIKLTETCLFSTQTIKMRDYTIFILTCPYDPLKWQTGHILIIYDDNKKWNLRFFEYIRRFHCQIWKMFYFMSSAIFFRSCSEKSIAADTVFRHLFRILSASSTKADAHFLYFLYDFMLALVWAIIRPVFSSNMSSFEHLAVPVETIILPSMS